MLYIMLQIFFIYESPHISEQTEVHHIRLNTPLGACRCVFLVRFYMSTMFLCCMSGVYFCVGVI